MKDNKWFKGLHIFFAIIGFLFTAGLIVVFLTNLAGISSLLSVIGLVKTQSLYEVDSAGMIQGATNGIVSSLGDPYSSYLNKNTWEDVKVHLEAKFGGVGVYILQDDQGRFKILSPIKGTPAQKAGIKHGDIILKINNESTMNMSQDEVVNLMRGDAGTQLTLTVYRESDGKEYAFKIIREIINIPSVETEIIDSTPAIGYLRLNTFSSQSDQEVADALNELIGKNNVKGIIFDLRNNGGGEFNSAVSIANLFLKDGAKVVIVRDSKGNEEIYRASGDNVDIPLVILVNQDTASASEILAGALQDNGRAILVGNTTFGKGVMQTVFPLRDGGALKLTTQSYYTPKGTDINKIGIKPDYEVDYNPESEQDAQLNKAIDLLKKQIF